MDNRFEQTKQQNEMNDMIAFLKKYREEEPEWLRDYANGKQPTFSDVMSSRVGYYPGYYQRCECDGTLIKVANMSQTVHSFLYVDSTLGRTRLEENLAQSNSFNGYHLAGKIEWQESDLPPIAQHHIFKAKGDKQETPYCFTAIMERDEEKNDTWGAKLFAITFLFANSIDVYYWLFIKEYSKAPWILLLNEAYSGLVLEKYIRGSHNLPSFVIFAKNARKWDGYEKVDNVHPVFGQFRKRRDLYALTPVIDKQ